MVGPLLDGVKTLDQLDVRNKRVLLRVDFNVPMRQGVVTDDERIQRAIPTIRELIQRGASVILLAHLGRPSGPGAETSLKQLLPLLQKSLCPSEVLFAEDFDSQKTQETLSGLRPGQVLLLENLRFWPEEKENDALFAKKLAALGDVYINDAFSVSHRSHASVAALPRLMVQKGMGRLMQGELKVLGNLLHSPKRPLLAILGGAKIETKLPLLERLTRYADRVVLGGAMAFALLDILKDSHLSSKFCGMKSLSPPSAFLQQMKTDRGRLVFPIDVIIKPPAFLAQAPCGVQFPEVPKGWEIVDIGPATQKNIKELLQSTQTVLWNGPLGVFEEPPFNEGTRAVAQAIASRTREGNLVSIVGGGDTGAALVQSGAACDFSYISAAGGAFLEFLEGKELPGLSALKASQ